MGFADRRRVSQTEMKAVAGFRAELPGLDLSTLIQLTCARRERLVVRVSSYGEEGFLYSVAGRIVHATLGALEGEEAVVRMLGWHTGDFAICELPFPETATIQRSTNGLLQLAEQRADESALDEVLTSPDFARPSRPPLPPARESRPPMAPIDKPVLRTSSLPPAPSYLRSHGQERASTEQHERPTLLPPAERTRSVPPPPPPSARKSAPQGELLSDPAVIASVRVDARGTLVAAYGSSDHLAQLVAYVSHLVGLIQADFSLDLFQALHAELAGLRVVIFQEAGDLVGITMQPGTASQELRNRLGV